MRMTFRAGLFAVVACGGESESSVPEAGLGDAGAVVQDAFIPDGAAIASDAGPCGEFENATKYVCSSDGLRRGKCIGGSLIQENCARGCLRETASAEAACLSTSNNFSCTGSYGKARATDGDYYITAFGCWIDDKGVAHGDPGDNCIPTCLDEAKAAGLCKAGETGKQCEERVNWFTADGARFGCLARLRVTNPKTGKSVIAVALDFGPGCTVENSVSKTVLDTSGRIDRQLFGADQGASDRTLVHVVEVDKNTPLGPVP